MITDGGQTTVIIIYLRITNDFLDNGRKVNSSVIILISINMKLVLHFLVVFLGIAGYSFGQQTQGKAIAPLPRGNMTKTEIIDSASIRILYAFNANDIKIPNSYMDLQCLEIGTYISKYYSYWVFNNDSLVWAWKRENPSAQSIPIRLGILGRAADYWSEYKYSEWFKNYDTNILTEYARMPRLFSSNQQYSEIIPLQNWTILPDTLSVVGYVCQKATCSFRGRDFIAWFAMDLPVRDGPWKFGGLPGLILKVYDIDLLYTFECVKIEQGKFLIKQYDFSSYKKVKREKILQLQKKLNVNFIKVFPRIVSNGVIEDIDYEALELE